MLNPPPESPDKFALEPEGKKKYLQSLQTRLTRLEGNHGHMTSKDILSALSEARDDHLIPATSPQNDNTATSLVNEFIDIDEEEEEEGRWLSCCWCCNMRKHRYRRGRRITEEQLYLIDCDELELSSTKVTEESTLSDSSHNHLINEPSSGGSTTGFEDNFVSS